jgi:hypothetical protein
VQDGQVAGQTSTVVRKYRGELALERKVEILEKITFSELQFFQPATPRGATPV